MIQNTENWSKHSLGVARYMKKHAEERNLNPEEMFVVGLLHDVGYEFSSDNHENCCADILKRMGVSKNCAMAIRLHGTPPSEVKKMYGEAELTNEYFLLIEADGRVDGYGKECSPAERINETKKRHGENSWQYQTAIKTAEDIKKYPARIRQD